MKQEIMIAPAVVNFWDSYLPRDAGMISVEEKLRCLLKIAFANMVPPQHVWKHIVRGLQEVKPDSSLLGSV